LYNGVDNNDTKEGWFLKVSKVSKVTKVSEAKYTKGYQKLIVWQRAKELVVIVYKITEKFPKSEEFGLKSQMRRAAISILSQIAEGYSRKSIKDKKRFIEISIGSHFELESDIEVSHELGFVDKSDYEILISKKGEVGYLLDRYTKSF
jgi:four helix bundle protein